VRPSHVFLGLCAGLAACARGSTSTPAPAPTTAVAAPSAASPSDTTAIPCPPPPMAVRGEGPAYFGYQVERQAEPYGRLPRPTLRPGEEGQRGRVNVAFLVNTDGTVDMRMVKVFHSDGPALTAAVCRALPQARFRPATLHGRAVRMVYQTEFRF